MNRKPQYRIRPSESGRLSYLPWVFAAIPQASSFQVCLRQVGAVQHCSFQVGLFQVGPLKISLCQIGFSQVCPSKVDPLKIGLPELSPE